MLNNMVASFTASNMVGNQWKGNKKKTKAKTILPLTDKENQQDDNPRSRNNIYFTYNKRPNDLFFCL
jgi:hypothetical protein